MIATEGTVKSGAWEKAIRAQIPEIEIVSRACPMLAQVAEEGKAKSQEGRAIIKEYMEIFKKRKIQDIILGCTHYPIYEEVIREELGYEVNLIHTGKTVAEYLQKYLGEEKGENQNPAKIFLTKKEEHFIEIAKNIFQIDFEIKTLEDEEIV